MGGGGRTLAFLHLVPSNRGFPLLNSGCSSRQYRYMLCFLCGKDIGWLRTMVDRQYCSAEHRKDARLASSNALRDEEEEQEIWSVAKTRQRVAGRSAPSNQTASIFAFLTLGALLV